MKKLFMILVIALFPFACFSQEIESTVTGGDWNNPETWINGKIPDVNSDVVINGNVIVKESNSCKNIKIMKEATLEFGPIKDSSRATISEILDIIDGTIIIQDKWYVFTNKIFKTEEAIINNLGIIKVGN
jgi:hypothetical protein